MEDVRRKHTYHILIRYKLIMFEFDFSILQAHQVLHPLLLALTNAHFLEYWSGGK